MHLVIFWSPQSSPTLPPARGMKIRNGENQSETLIYLGSLQPSKHIDGFSKGTGREQKKRNTQRVVFLISTTSERERDLTFFWICSIIAYT